MGTQVLDTQVLIVGAGPVGLTLAVDLGRRGVRCMLIEKNAAPLGYPKMEPLLKSAAEGIANVSVKYGVEFIAFSTWSGGEIACRRSPRTSCALRLATER
jgi:NADPH-dependent 2,4-dienoyl-CoA reductase/sulfur reductase-like enzyme